MSSLVLLLAALPLPAQQAEAAPTPAEVWQQVQDRYAAADAVRFAAEGRLLLTTPRNPGLPLAQIRADVAIGRAGRGSAEYTVQTGNGESARDLRVASVGTDEGVYSVDVEQNVAFACGSDWAESGELDDFLFLGATWSGFCARQGAPDRVAFVPTHAEHPGLQGLRVAWDGEQGQAPRSAVFWLNGDGLVESADVRFDATAVLHWEFRDWELLNGEASALDPIALPAGCTRGAGAPAPAVATPATETTEPVESN